MDFEKYIGKAWIKSAPKGSEESTVLYFIDIKKIKVMEAAKDEDGRTIFDKVPYKKGKGFKRVMRRQPAERIAFLAIKSKMVFRGSGSIRYSITNPTGQYAVKESFFENLKRHPRLDKAGKDCVEFLFESGVEKWKKNIKGIATY